VLQNSRTVQKMLETVVDRGRLQRLFTEADRPIVALRIRHPAWFVPHGQLASFSIPAAQKMTRRGFDNLFFPHLVVVGLFKVFADPTDYKIELHLIVAGASKIKLERAFHDARAEHIGSVRRAIDNMVNGRLQTRGVSGEWKTIRPYGEEMDQNSEQWPEYIRWLRINFRSLVFRYGCDRYWNRLRKNSRKKPEKVKKRHPYPYWLEPYSFAGPRWEKGVDNKPRQKAFFDPEADDSDYFDLED
jgi:hypothetical protein